MIKAKGLTFGYKGQKAVLENISFQVRRGEVLCVLGPNGAGKTTLLKIVAGIICPLSGSCTIEGINSKNLRLAYVPQKKQIPFNYSIVDFITFGLGGNRGHLKEPTAEDYARAENVLVRLGAGHLREKYINQVSGGELQLCTIAKALVSEPDVIILDEPESNLDFKYQNRILSLLHELSREEQKTIIMNTHFLNHASKVADTCLLIRPGHYVCGPTSLILNDDLLSQYFDVPIRANTSKVIQGAPKTFTMPV